MNFSTESPVKRRETTPLGALPSFLPEPAIEFSIPTHSITPDKFTVYRLKMHTSNYGLGSWELEKRYSEFYNLHHSLAKRRKHLPKFPPKKLKNMKDQVIEERKEALSKYMNELVACFNIFADPEVTAFISMKDKEKMRKYFKSLYEYQETIMKFSGHKISDVSDRSANSEETQPSQIGANKSPVKPTSSQPIIGGAGAGPTGFGNKNALKSSFSAVTSGGAGGVTESEKRILELLDQLEHDQGTFSNNLKIFEQYFLDERPMLSPNYITRLLLGDGYKQRGLFQHLRDLDPSSISGSNLLSFVARLLDSRRNHQIEQFRQILIKYELKYMTELKLYRYVQNQQTKEIALYILNEYFTAHPHIPPIKLLNTTENETQYERWRQTKQVAQKSYQSKASTSPVLRAGTVVAGQPKMKKQSSFLIESKPQRRANQSFIDLEADDNKSDISGKSHDVGAHKSTRLKQQNSAHGLITKEKLGLTGAFRGLDKNHSTFFPGKKAPQNEIDDNSSMGDDKSAEMLDDYDSGDDAFKNYFNKHLAHRDQQQQLNLRKVTADFNNYYLEPKQASVKQPSPLDKVGNQGNDSEEKKNQQQSPQFPGEAQDIHRNNLEDNNFVSKVRRESFAVECDQEIRELIQCDILKYVQITYSVNFHNIQIDDVKNKIVQFKLDKSYQSQANDAAATPTLGQIPERRPDGINVTNLIDIVQRATVGQELSYEGSPFKFIIVERLSKQHVTANIEYQIPGDEGVYCFPYLVLLSFIEIGNHAYVTIFPFEQHQANFENTDVGSSEAVSHLSNKDFVLIRQEIKGKKIVATNLRGFQMGAIKSGLVGARGLEQHRGTVDVGRLRGFGDAEGGRLLQQQNKPLIGKQPSFSTASTSNLTKSSGASLMTNIKSSGASLMGGGAKDSGASLQQLPFRSTISDLAGGRPNPSTFHKKSADMTQTTTTADDEPLIPIATSTQLAKNQSQTNLSKTPSAPSDSTPKANKTNSANAPIVESSQEDDTSRRQSVEEEICPVYTTGDIFVTVKLAEENTDILSLILTNFACLERQTIFFQPQ